MPPVIHCRQNELGLIRVSGRDARAFLHAQLTQNIADLEADRSTLAAWLSAQGRVRALFDVIANGDSFLLLTAADNVDPTVRQLGMFVLRADASIESPGELEVHALVGDASEWLADRDLRLGPHQVVVRDELTWLRLSPNLVQAVGSADRLEASFAGLEGSDAAPAEREAVQLGLPIVPAALRERYIPQMLNLDRLNAISFTKGCYPGQEIVARTHNLGTVKRRLLPFTTGPGAAPSAGAAIVDEAGSDVGEVNRSAPTESGHALLAVVRLESLNDGLTLADDGRRLEPMSAT